MTIFFDEKEPMYCGNCGKQLHYKVCATYYHERSGEPYHHYHYWCPNYVWWKPWKAHANWKCDDSGSTYVYEH